MADAANSTTLTPALLFESMAEVDSDANVGISQITAATSGDKFYIVAYDGNDVMIFFADAGANNVVLVGEVNLVAHITGPDIAVGGLEAGDFILA